LPRVFESSPSKNDKSISVKHFLNYVNKILKVT
jgi:hypothetical protein